MSSINVDQVDALITHRLIDFYSGLIRRAQIASTPDQLLNSLIVAGSAEVLPDVRFLCETDS